jgi:AcrR family transcriptional regulator
MRRYCRKQRSSLPRGVDRRSPRGAGDFRAEGEEEGHVQEPRGSVEDDERTRIFRAIAAAVSARGGSLGGGGGTEGSRGQGRGGGPSRGGDSGGGPITLADLAARAEVSPRRLRGQFADVEACFLAAFEWCSERAGAAMAQAYADEHGWVEAIRSALAAALELIEQEPDLARLWIVYALGAGPRVLHSRAAAIATLAEYVDRGRLESRVRAEPPAITAEGVVGALLVVLQTRLLASKSEPLTALRGELTSLILLPYLGSAAARRELVRPTARSSTGRRPGSPRSGRAVMEGVGPRVTYRTARVLTAIAERPGSSNREIANRAEIVDQGQISKLLSRLEDQGLIANVGGGGLRGAPNAWELTLRGEQIQHTIARMAATFERSGRR